jgi:hypothetical protein
MRDNEKNQIADNVLQIHAVSVGMRGGNSVYVLL